MSCFVRCTLFELAWFSLVCRSPSDPVVVGFAGAPVEGIVPKSMEGNHPPLPPPRRPLGAEMIPALQNISCGGCCWSRPQAHC